MHACKAQAPERHVEVAQPQRCAPRKAAEPVHVTAGTVAGQLSGWVDLEADTELESDDERD